MPIYSISKTTKIASLVTSAIIFNACSNDNSEEPTQTIEPTSIRGVYAIAGTTNNSGNNSIGQLPSSTLPAASLAAGPLTSIEIDEMPSISYLRTLNIELQAKQQVGNTVPNTPLTAVALVEVNEQTGTVSAMLTVENIAQDDSVTMVHIHSGFAGENGPVLAGFSKQSDNPAVYALNTHIDQLASEVGNDLETFLDGGWYINLHTNSQPSGHLRGQIYTNEISVSRTVLEGQQQNPAIVNAPEVSGIGYITVNPLESEIVANVAVQGFTPFLDVPIGPVHLHNGFAGENGGVFLPLAAIDDSAMHYRATEIDLIDSIDFARIAEGGTYINVHSAANSGGEVRGQIVPKGVSVSRSELQGAQQNPATTNAEGVSGIAYITLDSANETLVANVAVQGFEPFLDAPVGPVHLHSGFAGENGPVLLPLSPQPDSSSLYRGTHTDAIAELDFAQITQGGSYINVHSAANPAGEVRGQILVGDVVVVRTELQTQQTVPAVTLPSSQDVSGVGYATFDRNNADVSPILNVRVSGFGASAVHLHRGGVAGVAGPVQIGLEDISPAEAPGTVFSATNGDIFSLQGLKNGAYYFNAHSSANPAGEIRGQVLTNETIAFHTALTVPTASSDTETATATGNSFMTVNLNQQSFIANLQVENFSPAQVSINVGGDNNRFFTPFTNQGNGFFDASGQVNSLQGLLNGGYSIEATTTAP